MAVLGSNAVDEIQDLLSGQTDGQDQDPESSDVTESGGNIALENTELRSQELQESEFYLATFIRQKAI